MDFFVREVRAVVDGPMWIIRFGSCGSIRDSVKVGQICVVDSAVMITRNWDYFSSETDNKERLGNKADIPRAVVSAAAATPYLISKPVLPDATLTKNLLAALSNPSITVTQGLNASADTFYASQGRRDVRFADANSELIDTLRARHPGAATLEMETFVLIHLARCTTRAVDGAVSKKDTEGEVDVKRRRLNDVTATGPRNTAIEKKSRGEEEKVGVAEEDEGSDNNNAIRVAGCHIVFADRTGGGFITPEVVEEMEKSGGEACLRALASL